MSKMTISRLFEVSQYLTTEAGKELKDALTYLSEFVEVTVRALRNGLTVDDNFAAIVKSVNIISGTEEVVLPSTERRRVKAIMVRKVVSDESYSVTAFGWKYDVGGNVRIKVTLEGAPTDSIPVQIAILF